MEHSRVIEHVIFGLDATMSINFLWSFLGCKDAAQQMISQDPYPAGDRGWIQETIVFTFGPLGMSRSMSFLFSFEGIRATDDSDKVFGIAALHLFRGLVEPEDIGKVAGDATVVAGTVRLVAGKLFSSVTSMFPRQQATARADSYYNRHSYTHI